MKGLRPNRVALRSASNENITWASTTFYQLECSSGPESIPCPQITRASF